MLRALDLYSGIGGWTVGLETAGIKVVRSYEQWRPAVDTYNANFLRAETPVDIRSLPLTDLPKGIDIVVGSPPCTQFSYSNRGGNGDLDDGLLDLEQFLRIVEYLKPKFWAMENVPRVSGILESELRNGRLRRYASLVTSIITIDASEFGVPQRRRRMIAGCFPSELFLSYRNKGKALTLAAVIESLARTPPLDPVYGGVVAQSKLTEMELEPHLSSEELRMNRDAKLFHPVYNTMPFPDAMDRPARTVTALCTRISRESIVVPDQSNPSRFRRLTIRERACLQSFPCRFQFHGWSYAQKAKLIGNALPPLLAYYMGSAMRERPKSEVARPTSRHLPQLNANQTPPLTEPKVSIDRLIRNRRFRSALPHLRFGSGNRFELSNSLSAATISWKVHFYFGPSKAFRTILLNKWVLKQISRSVIWHEIADSFSEGSNRFLASFRSLDASELQTRWEHHGQKLTPYDLVDSLGDWVLALSRELEHVNQKEIELLFKRLFDRSKLVSTSSSTVSSNSAARRVSQNLTRQKSRVIAGILVGSWFNSSFSLRGSRRR